MDQHKQQSERTVTLIIPAAADGPRVSKKPTWLLTHPRGNIVLLNVLSALDLEKVSRIVVAVKASHVMKFCGGSLEAVICTIHEQLPGLPAIEFVQLKNETTSSPATVLAALEQCKIEGPIFIKDCDGSFDHRIVEGNTVVSMQLSSETRCDVENLPSKSFVEHCNGVLTNIQEKKITSDCICVGGYGFNSASNFVLAYGETMKLQNSVASTTGARPRLFVSHLIQFLMLDRQQIFSVAFTKTFDDWKTDSAWRRYVKSHQNILVALEGVLFKCKPETQYTGLERKNSDLDPVTQNIEYLRRVYESKRTWITVTTHRTAQERQETEKLLTSNGVPFDNILYGMMRCTTFVVGGYGEDLHHPSAVSYCVPDGSEQLGSVLHLV